jgi:rhodanese-related sulfurtransferase
MIPSIDVTTLKEQYDNNPNVCIIDVREADEWAQGHIPNAHHIPKHQLTSHIHELGVDSTHPIYLHCRSGVRSLQAAEALQALGFTAVYSLEGGIIAWANAGYPITYPT